MDRETVKTGFELCANGEPCMGEKFMKCPFSPRNNAEQNCGVTMARNALTLLKEQEEQKRKWLKSIADNQLANAPTDTMDEKTKEHFYGVWCGLEIAYGILTEES